MSSESISRLPSSQRCYVGDWALRCLAGSLASDRIVDRDYGLARPHERPRTARKPGRPDGSGLPFTCIHPRARFPNERNNSLNRRVSNDLTHAAQLFEYRGDRRLRCGRDRSAAGIRCGCGRLRCRRDGGRDFGQALCRRRVGATGTRDSHRHRTSPRAWTARSSSVAAANTTSPGIAVSSTASTSWASISTSRKWSSARRPAPMPARH